jgi:hypothetical protein
MSLIVSIVLFVMSSCDTSSSSFFVLCDAFLTSNLIADEQEIETNAKKTSSSSVASTSSNVIESNQEEMSTQNFVEHENETNDNDNDNNNNNDHCAVSTAMSRKRKAPQQQEQVQMQQEQVQTTPNDENDDDLNDHMNDTFGHSNVSLVPMPSDMAAVQRATERYLQFCMTGHFLDSLSDTTERAEYVDLLHYLFVEWCTRDEASVREPVAERHVHFRRELIAWMMRSNFLFEASTVLASDMATNQLQQDQQQQQQQQRQSTSSTARGKRGIAMQQIEELRLPSIRVLAQERLNERYVRARGERYRPRASTVMIAVMRTALTSTFHLLAIEDIAAMRARLNERAAGVSVNFVVFRGDESTCDTSTTIRVPLPFAVNVPATLSAWREYVHDVSRRPVSSQYLRAYAVLCAKSNMVHCVMISNRHSCTCDENGREFVKCVHVLFVLVRVLRVPLNDYVLYQRALVDKELFAIFSRRSTIEQLADNYWPSSLAGSRRPLLLDSECRICCTACIERTEPYCCKCGRNFHAQCMVRWREHQNDRLAPRCPVCLHMFE